MFTVFTNSVFAAIGGCSRVRTRRVTQGVRPSIRAIARSGRHPLHITTNTIFEGVPPCPST